MVREETLVDTFFGTLASIIAAREKCLLASGGEVQEGDFEHMRLEDGKLRLVKVLAIDTISKPRRAKVECTATGEHHVLTIVKREDDGELIDSRKTTIYQDYDDAFDTMNEKALSPRASPLKTREGATTPLRRALSAAEEITDALLSPRSRPAAIADSPGSSTEKQAPASKKPILPAFRQDLSTAIESQKERSALEILNDGWDSARAMASDAAALLVEEASAASSDVKTVLSPRAGADEPEESGVPKLRRKDDSIVSLRDDLAKAVADVVREGGSSPFRRLSGDSTREVMRDALDITRLGTRVLAEKVGLSPRRARPTTPGVKQTQGISLSSSLPSISGWLSPRRERLPPSAQERCGTKTRAETDGAFVPSIRQELRSVSQEFSEKGPRAVFRDRASDVSDIASDLNAIGVKELSSMAFRQLIGFKGDDALKPEDIPGEEAEAPAAPAAGA